MIPLSRHGWKEMAVATLVLGGLAWLACLWWWPLAVLPTLVLGWVFSFFRDPERAVPEGADLLVSPADGTVTDVTEVADPPLLAEPAIRVGIFLSVFNVHVNRSPLAGRVTGLRYRPGRFLDARHPDATTQNEAQDVLLEGAHYPVLVRQISGLIARRIVCPLREGQELGRGERFGLIKFGSRTELYVPARLRPEILVRPGQAVRGAATALVRVDPEVLRS